MFVYFKKKSFLNERKILLKTKEYLFNIGTGTLHYRGCCQYAHEKMDKVQLFDTENEVYQNAGRGVRVCKTCQKNREKQIHI